MSHDEMIRADAWESAWNRYIDILREADTIRAALDNGIGLSDEGKARQRTLAMRKQNAFNRLFHLDERLATHLGSDGEVDRATRHKLKTETLARLRDSLRASYTVTYRDDEYAGQWDGGERCPIGYVRSNGDSYPFHTDTERDDIIDWIKTR